MPDLIRLVVELAAAFERLKLRYALGGALATSYWGIERTTLDVDCLVAIPAVSYQSLADELAAIDCEQLDDSGNVVHLSVARMREQASRSPPERLAGYSRHTSSPECQFGFRVSAPLERVVS